MTKLKIDLRNGTLEVEGEEAFVQAVYQDYKDKIGDVDPIGIEGDNLDKKAKKVKTPHKQNNTTKRKETYQIIKDLNLVASGDKKALKDFYKEKSPSLIMEKNTTFVYYLEKIVKVKNISANHVYTCYKDIGEKVPGALAQSLRDTSSKKGWIDAKEEGYVITTRGENLVELELPRKEEDNN